MLDLNFLPISKRWTAARSKTLDWYTPVTMQMVVTPAGLRATGVAIATEQAEKKGATWTVTPFKIK